MQALEKITLAYLALQERADKLQADKDAMFSENQSLSHKLRATKENNRFLQSERDRLSKQCEAFKSAYKQSQESNKGDLKDYSEEMRNLKACIEELESQLVALTPKEQRIDEPTDGYEAEKRVCRQYFKASETTEKADGAAKPVILLRTLAGDDAGGWITERITKTNGDTTFGTNSYLERAKQFANLDEVGAFLGKDYPLELIGISYHHPKTLQPVNVVTATTE